jgi:hypothetical protein
MPYRLATPHCVTLLGGSYESLSLHVFAFICNASTFRLDNIANTTPVMSTPFGDFFAEFFRGLVRGLKGVRLNLV